MPHQDAVGLEAREELARLQTMVMQYAQLLLELRQKNPRASYAASAGSNTRHTQARSPHEQIPTKLAALRAALDVSEDTVYVDAAAPNGGVPPEPPQRARSPHEVAAAVAPTTPAALVAPSPSPYSPRPIPM